MTTWIAGEEGLEEVEISTLTTDQLDVLIIEAGAAGDTEAVNAYRTEKAQR